MEKKREMSKDFLLVVIGQIISLFGNAVIRFALPLHLLNETGSASLLGIVSGLAFIPLAIMAPIGGLIADRVNKRNIMVVLDFFTAGIVLVFISSYGKIDLVTMILITLFLLYGISGAYQPSVQASVPLLVSEKKILPANAIINMVSSLSGLLGPALGGILYNIYGILPVLYVCMGCFTLSAIMELFIKIPFKKRTRTKSMILEAKNDLKQSIHFVSKERSEIGKLTVCCAGINLVLSALMMIGFPVIVMQMLNFPQHIASQMYGFLQAAMAIGGLGGGLLSGILSSKMNIQNNWKLLFFASLCLLPMGLVLVLGAGAYVTYSILTIFGCLIMMMATIYTIQIMSYIQIITPTELIGKVISCILAISTCAQPIGQVVYGVLFDKLKGMEGYIFFIAAIISALIAWFSKATSEKL